MSLKIVDSIKDVSSGGRVDRYWQKKIESTFKKYRNPSMKLPAKFKVGDQYEIAKTFNFRGFEYGNWTTQQNRQDFLLGLVVALYDLQKVTGFGLNFGLDKTIGIAYGARGQGGNAAAHFEPYSFMINLTKTSGAGSLAHEYGHALDYFFGTYIEQNISSRALSGDAGTKKGGMRQTMAKILELIKYKPDGKETRYFENLPDGYWSRDAELFARAFEQYVGNVLAKRGIVNNLLSKTKYTFAIYLPQDIEKKVHPHMAKLIKQMSVYAKK